MATWFPHIVNWCQSPPQLQRRLVAVGDRVYVTLGLHAPLSVLDAATGDVLEEYENTRGTEEIVCHDRVLLLAVQNVTSQRTDELARWARLVEQKGSPLYARETAEPLVKRLRATEAGGEKSVLAIDADSGRLLWKKTGAEIAGLRPLSLCANADRAFYENGKDVVCLDLKSGRQRWSVAPPAKLRVVHDGRVFCAGGKTVTALSAETGETLWTEAASLVDFRDVFVAGGSLCLGGFKPIEGKRSPAWGPYFVTQRDPATGEILMHIEPENPGHHHRCYSNKATDRYILGGRRGTEFIDLATGDVLWHSWARGGCRYGVMPCNGLLYTPPHACGCYMTAKLTGFSALAPAGKTESGKREAESPARWEQGPAYGSPDASRPSVVSEDWATYRGDGQRSGHTRTAVPAVLQRRWQTEIGGELTAPTVAGGKVFAAAVDRHEVVALDADSGEPAWHFTAGARVDSPPTLHKGQAIFGCRDGFVYSVRASDGVLAWRRQAARRQRRVVVDGQLESVSPVPGSVLVRDDVVYCTSGRSSYLDGGIDLHRIEPDTGKILSQTPIFSPDPQTGRQPPQSAPAVMPGARADILTADEGHVYLRDMVFDPGGERLKQGTDHLFTLTDFLDDSWPHRSYWIFGTRCSIATGCSRRDKNLVFGRLLVFNDATIFGYGRKLLHWSNRLQDGAYRLFATHRAAGTEQWAHALPIQVRAMLLSGEVLFVAGPTVSAADPLGPADEQPASMLLAVSATDGTVLAEYPLDAPPVFDGLAATAGRLYLTTIDGKVTCFAGEKSTAKS
ncbi:MAG: PQQ-binding-like beta-propeller repeat protein, partial [Planctomycetes bacterium]|nr:PQQ-binding-like beta-propeller repeat protein [Planctomycetota bacterium]